MTQIMKKNTASQYITFHYFNMLPGKHQQLNFCSHSVFPIPPCFTVNMFSSLS